MNKEVTVDEMKTRLGDKVYKHVRVSCNDPEMSLMAFKKWIEIHYPGNKFWRHKPSRAENHNHLVDRVEITLYARFSMELGEDAPKDPSSSKRSSLPGDVQSEARKVVD